ncbi:COG4978 Transcriptional regulator, effector-binding domain/component [Rhabdaerophilaceae bacterium]
MAITFALAVGFSSAVAQPSPPAPLPTPIPGQPLPAPAPQPNAPPPSDMEKPSADASTGQIIDLPARPVLRLRAQSTWDDGFVELKKSLAMLMAEAQRLGLATAGQPLAHFIDSDDLGFTYEAMLPLVGASSPGLVPAQGVEIASSPAGRAVTFTHEGPYDEIDAAYEAITAFLDEKGLTATGQFIEEYLVLPEKSDDPGMRIGITILLK